MSQRKIMPSPNPKCWSTTLGCEEFDYETHKTYTVECCCGMAGPRCGTEAEAIKAWNSLLRPYVWSKKPPKKPGWYWWRWANFQEVICLEVREGLMVEYPHRVLQSVSAIGGEWAGPIHAAQEKNEKK